MVRKVPLAAEKSRFEDCFKIEHLPDHKPAPVMRITCSRCGFQFYEKPLDGGKGEVKL